MTHKQYPIGSGFGPAATADEVLAGIDLTGKNVIVTGGHGRLGLEMTRALSKVGAAITVAARDAERAAASVAGIAGVEVSRLDLVEPKSIDAFTKRWLASRRPLHILINNATAPVAQTRSLDARGYELQFATGHLGHFQLTLGLLPALRSAHGARVVSVSSGAHRFGEIHWDDLSLSNGYEPHVAYAQTKKANVLFTVELDRRYAADAIRAYAVHPGVVVDVTPRDAPREASLRSQGLIDDAGQPIIDPQRGKKTPQQGASTVVFAATSPLLDQIGGVYLKDNDIARLDDSVRPLTADDIPSEAASHSIDPQAAKRLWELSERLLAG